PGAPDRRPPGRARDRDGAAWLRAADEPARLSLAGRGRMTLLDELAALLGPQGCLTGDRVPEAARSDASRSGRVLPLAVLRPASVEEVSQALALCHAAGQTVVPQGGLTGLAGGANPRADDIALSLQRLAGIEEIDRGAAT